MGNREIVNGSCPSVVCNSGAERSNFVPFLRPCAKKGKKVKKKEKKRIAGPVQCEGTGINWKYMACTVIINL